MHVPELHRLGADIAVDGKIAMVKGVPAPQRRAGDGERPARPAALVLAGLAAQGKTDVRRVYHLDRGYEHIEAKLQPSGPASAGKPREPRCRPGRAPLRRGPQGAAPQGPRPSSSARWASPPSRSSRTRGSSPPTARARPAFISIRPPTWRATWSTAPPTWAWPASTCSARSPATSTSRSTSASGAAASSWAGPEGAPPSPRRPAGGHQIRAHRRPPLRREGHPGQIIPLHGSVEIAPSLGLADLIVDVAGPARPSATTSSSSRRRSSRCRPG